MLTYSAEDRELIEFASSAASELFILSSTRIFKWNDGLPDGMVVRDLHLHLHLVNSKWQTKYKVTFPCGQTMDQPGNWLLVKW